jgi:hypothetical protein
VSVLRQPQTADYFGRELGNLSVSTALKKSGKNGSFWDLRDPIVSDSRKLLRGGMFPPQREWWNLPNFVRVFVAGYGGGKTFVGAKRAISLALTNSQCPGAAVSPSYGIAKRTVVRTIIDLLVGKQSLVGNKELVWSYNAGEHVFTIRYHGRVGIIYILSGDNPRSLIGPNLAWAWIDEPFVQDVDVFTQMIARIRHPNATLLELNLTGTPEQLNWGYDLCIGEMEDYTDVGVVRASTRGNLVLPADYVGRLESAFSEKAAKAYIEGQFINLSEGQVYYGFDPLENVVERKMPSGAELGFGQDFNVNPMAGIVFWTKGTHIHFFHEYELPDSDTEYVGGYLRDQYGDKLRDCYPDASGRARHTNAPGGRSDFWYLEKAGFRINCGGENPPVRDRENAVNGKLKPRNGRISLSISPKCKRLIKYLSVYTHEQRNKQKAMSHLLDAFGYPIAHLFPASREKFEALRLRGY